jgi:hypothetical protein
LKIVRNGQHDGKVVPLVSDFMRCYICHTFLSGDVTLLFIDEICGGTASDETLSKILILLLRIETDTNPVFHRSGIEIVGLKTVEVL